MGEPFTNRVHICRASGQRFIAQSRQAGFRKWNTIKKTRSYKAALQAAARGIEQGAKRAQVWVEGDYYEPVCLVEMRRC